MAPRWLAVRQWIVLAPRGTKYAFRATSFVETYIPQACSACVYSPTSYPRLPQTAMVQQHPTSSNPIDIILRYFQRRKQVQNQSPDGICRWKHLCQYTRSIQWVSWLDYALDRRVQVYAVRSVERLSLCKASDLPFARGFTPIAPPSGGAACGCVASKDPSGGATRCGRVCFCFFWQMHVRV